MTATAAPFGFRPTKLLGDRPFTQGIRQYKIASGYNTAIYAGDPVKLVTGGTVEIDAPANPAETLTPIGVFLGVEFTDPNLGYLVHSTKWTASTVASDAMAYVCDDPDVVMEIQADATLSRNAIGTNAALISTAGNSATGRSKWALDASSIATTATLPVRVVGFRDEDEIGTTYPIMLVKWNEGDHQLRTTAGISPT